MRTVCKNEAKIVIEKQNKGINRKNMVFGMCSHESPNRVLVVLMNTKCK